MQLQFIFILSEFLKSWQSNPQRVPQSLHLPKRASVASNNDNVYKFINTAKKPSFIKFFVNFEF